MNCLCETCKHYRAQYMYDIFCPSTWCNVTGPEEDFACEGCELMEKDGKYHEVCRGCPEYAGRDLNE